MTNKISKLFTLLIITTFFSFSVKNIKFGKQSTVENIISVKFEFYGIDAQTIETIITTPLEKKLFQMGDIKEINSISQNDQAIFIIQFHNNTDFESSYLQTRNIVYDFYSTLPRSVQKPQLYTSNITKDSSICICVEANKDQIEKILKPELLKIDGIAQVQIIGKGEPYLRIQYDPEKLKKFNLDQSLISDSLNSYNHHNLIIPVNNEEHSMYFNFSNSLYSIEDIKNIPILSNQHNINLSDIAKIDFLEKENNHNILLNNHEITAINILAASENKLIHISNSLTKLLKNNSISKFNPIILYDSGNTQLNEIVHSSLSLFITLLIISVFILCLYKSFSICLKLIFTVSVCLIWTLGTLTICNTTINSQILCGITLSIGLIVDMPLSVLNTSNNIQIERIKPSLLKATITTILALSPLILSGRNFIELKTISISISLMVIYSTLISLFFLESLIQTNTSDKIIFTYLLTSIHKKLTNIKFPILLFYLCSFIGFVLFFIIDYEQVSENNNITTANIEFNPERKNSLIQNELNEISKDFNNIEKLKYFKTETMRGNGKIEFIFTKAPSEKTICKIKEKLSKIKNASLYISSNISTKNFNFQIAVTGPDYEKCQHYCKIIAKELSFLPFVNQAVLNFKNPEKSYLIIPDINKASFYNISTYGLCTQLRWLLYTPVISKYLNDIGETDVQLEPSATTTLENIQTLLYENKTNSKTLNTITELKEKLTPQKIYHLNGKPCAHITLELQSLTHKTLSSIHNELKKMNIPNDYQVNFNEDVITHKNNILKLKFLSLITILIIFLYLLASNENIKKSFNITISILVTYILPELIMLFFNKKISYGIITGLFILAGTSVNNMIYISDHPKYHINTIIITSLTTIISSLINIIFSNNYFSKDISFIILTGTLVSIFMSIRKLKV